jgi:hypothetical protein
MKRIVLLSALVLLLCAISDEAFAQSKKMTRKEKEAAWRAERLRKRAAEERIEIHNDSIEYLQAIASLKGGSWALEAGNLTFSNGTTDFVTENKVCGISAEYGYTYSSKTVSPSFSISNP